MPNPTDPATPFAVRALVATDEPAWRTLRQQALAERPADFAASPGEDPPEAAAWAARVADPARRVGFGAFDGARLVGIVDVEREAPAKLAHKAWLGGLYVVADARRRGVGRRLVQAVLEQAARWPGLRQVQLSVNAGNGAAIALYEACGFVRTGLEPGCLKAGGTLHDEWSMQRLLADAAPTAAPVTVIGSYLSPYVRKVLALLACKRRPYVVDPIVPFFGDDDFTRLNPWRRVPVLIDGDTVVTESSVIGEYLDERWPLPPMLPAAPAARARARAIEAFADARLGDAMVWHLFNQVVIRRFVWGEPPDEALLRQAREVEIPRALDHLEPLLPPEGFLFDAAIGRADIAVAVFFRNAAWARWQVEAARWPRCAALVARVLDHPALAALRPFEEVCLRTPIARHRDALREAGAPLSERSWGTDRPRRGPSGH